MAELLQRRINHTGPGNLTDCAMTTGTVPNIMASFRCELQDVMTALLDTTVVQILKLVQKDFLDQLKEKEQEIHGLHTKLQRMAGLPQAEVEEEMQAEAEKETVEEQTGTAVEQHNRETESNLSTDEPLIRQELAGNERNMKKDLEIIQLIEVVNAESLVEAAGAERITETESETFQSDIGAAVQFTDGGGQDGHENQREEKGQKAKRKGKRVRVKSENEDCDDLITEKMSSRIDEVVVLKLEDPAEVEQSESPGGAEHQVNLLEDLDYSCNGNVGSVTNLQVLKLPTSPNESTDEHCSVVTESKLSEGVKRNRCISPLATYNSQAAISEEYLEKAKVALTKMEDLPDRGWVLLDPLTGKFCIKDELDFKTERIEMDEQDMDAEEGPSSVPSGSSTHSVETEIQTTANISTQTEAQVIVVMTQDEFDKMNPNSTSAECQDSNRVVTRSSQANRASGSNTNETSDMQSQRGYGTRSTGNVVSDRTDEGVESGASSGSSPSKKGHSDNERGNVRFSKEVVIICSKVQKADAKKHSIMKVQASEASTSKKSHTASDKARSKNNGKGKKQSHSVGSRVYRSGHFVISQGSFTKSKKEIDIESSEQVYTAEVKVGLCNASEQGVEVKNEFQPKGKLFECKHCAKTFPNLTYLKKHWQYHSANKKHICSECGKGFVYECHLRIHMQSHTNDRPFQCNQCGKRFIYRSNLKYHLMYHTGEKPHVCLQCGMAFSRRGHLVKHITCHSGLRPYACSHCDKTFTAKGGLTRHERTHQKKSKRS